MTRISVDSEDEEIFPDESGKMSSVETANTRKKMRYLRKVFAVLALIFLIYAGACMTLFITPGVREFVQQHHSIFYLCVSLPIVSTLLNSFLKRLNFKNALLAAFVGFSLHLLSIFLAFTTISLFFDTEILYFSCFTVFLNLLILVLYTFQSYKFLTPLQMLVLLIAATAPNVLFVELFLAIFDFPYIHVALISLIMTFYIFANLRFFMKNLNSREWPMAIYYVFTRVPL
uniref:Uncharacterized protein n=1 Tax=Caenorhabditis japonica TaxID=281687 RepID=A0A8R1E0I7_CAEJA